MKRFLRNESDVKDVARELILVRLSSHSGLGAAVVGLRGDLGSGKTTLVRHVARELGISEHITSPTFVIEKVYEVPAGSAFDTLIHIDAYRLSNGKDMEALRWRDIVKRDKTLVCIEWPEFVADALPPDTLYVDMVHVDETTRYITW